MKKKTLYLGLNPKHYETDHQIVHFPVIEVAPRCFSNKEIQEVFSRVEKYTHIIFTSKSSVQIFFNYLKRAGKTLLDIEGADFVAIGRVTAKWLRGFGVEVHHIAEDETQEGMIDLLSTIELKESLVLLPQSSRARAKLAHYLVEKGVHHQIVHLYDTKTKEGLNYPPINQFDEIVFTSPSTVDAFFSTIPENEINDVHRYKVIGKITAEVLKEQLKIFVNA